MYMPVSRQAEQLKSGVDIGSTIHQKNNCSSTWNRINFQPVTLGEQALYQNLTQKLHELYDRDHLGMHAKVLKFHEGLEKQYARCHDYCLFHLLAGSTALDNYQQFDFPHPDSVETFVNTEYYRRFAVE